MNWLLEAIKKIIGITPTPTPDFSGAGEYIARRKVQEADYEKQRQLNGGNNNIQGAQFENSDSEKEIRNGAVLGTTLTPVINPYMPTPTPNPNPTPIPGFGVSENTPETDLFLDNVVLPITRKRGIPDEIAAGQFGREGRLGGVGAKRNNFYNLGITDKIVKEGLWNQAPKYGYPEEGIDRYGQLMSATFRYRDPETGKLTDKVDERYKPAYDLRDDPEAMLRKIGEIGYASDPNYVNNVMNTPEYQRYAKKRK